MQAPAAQQPVAQQPVAQQPVAQQVVGAVGGAVPMAARPVNMMSFVDSIKTCLTQKFADFGGRASRSEYWWFFLLTLIVSVVSGVIDGFVGIEITATQGLVGLITSLALFIPGIAVAIRRFHDLGKSGWWVLSFFIIIGIIYMFFDGEQSNNAYGAPPTNVL